MSNQELKPVPGKWKIWIPRTETGNLIPGWFLVKAWRFRFRSYSTCNAFITNLHLKLISVWSLFRFPAWKQPFQLGQRIEDFAPSSSTNYSAISSYMEHLLFYFKFKSSFYLLTQRISSRVLFLLVYNKDYEIILTRPSGRLRSPNDKRADT